MGGEVLENMRLPLVLLLSACSLAANAQQQEIQRALIQRDQQSAEFARKGLENLHSRQLQQVSQPLPTHLRPYQRERMKQEREQVGTEGKPVPVAPDYRPSPLPGGTRPLLDPVPAPSVSG